MFEDPFREARLIAAAGRKSELKGEHSCGNLAGNGFDDSRRTAAFSGQYSFEWVWRCEAHALCLWVSN